MSNRVTKPTKSYRGCKRCKAKKIKCDETKPVCQACVRAGVECPGFAPQFKWSRKHEAFDLPSLDRQSSKGLESGADKQRLGQDVEAADIASGLGPFDLQHNFDTPSELATPGTMTSWNNQMLMSLGFADFPNLDIGRYDDLPLELSMYDQPLQLSMPPTSDRRESLSQAWPSGSLTDNTASHIDPTQPVETDFEETEAGGAQSSSTVEEPQKQCDQAASTIGRGSLLGAFYRLSSPTSVAQFSEEHLVRHYFDTICSLYSCFDSARNPFRYLIADLWTKSTTIYLSIQSMAVAHLTNHFLYMAPLSRVKRSQSWKSLQRDLQLHRAGKVPFDQVLLSLLLLGLSSTWQQPTNLGLQYLSIARNLMQVYLEGSRSGLPYTKLPNENFFLDALLYWEMLASFVDPVPMEPFPGYGAPVLQQPTEKRAISPHPWTCIVPEIQFALGEIGRIMRRGQRLTTHSDGSGKPWSQEDRQWSSSLATYLTAMKMPRAEEILDYEDPNTPKSDLIRISDAYRYIGLLEIYQAFPSFLEEKLNQKEPFPDMYDGPLKNAFDTDLLKEQQSWLSTIATRTLGLIKTITLRSASCRHQALVLVSCATQLKLPNFATSPDSAQQAILDDILDLRGFVEARMLALSRKYPHRQMVHILDVVKEVWQRADDGDENVHWIDIIHEDGWPTMLG